jgi:hypothetical protein
MNKVYFYAWNAVKDIPDGSTICLADLVCAESLKTVFRPLWKPV